MTALEQLLRQNTSSFHKVVDYNTDDIITALDLTKLYIVYRIYF